MFYQPEMEPLKNSGCIKLTAFLQDVAVNQPDVVAVFFKVGRCCDNQVESHSGTTDILIEFLGNRTAAGAFRNYHQQVNVAVCEGVVSGNRPKKNNLERMNQRDDLLNKIIYGCIGR